jgi:hypothetical protein
MKVGIISFAHMHAHSYALQLNHHPAATLSAIWHADEDQGQEIANRYNTSFYPELADLLQSDLDAVIVCSENAKHKDHVIAAARAGRHRHRPGRAPRAYVLSFKTCRGPNPEVMPASANGCRVETSCR